MGELIFGEETEKIIGACFEVYRVMGHGFLESVYQECLGLEFKARAIPVQAQVPLVLKYKEERLNQKYTPDYLCFGKIVLEIKAVQEIAKEHQAQVVNYLRATGMKVGILANFGHHPGLEVKRVIF